MDEVEEQAPRIQHEGIGVSPDAVAAVLEALVDELYEQAPRLQHEGIGVPSNAVETLLALANSIVYLATHPPVGTPEVGDPAALAEALVAQATQMLTDGSLPINVNDAPESIAGDISHLAPVGTDLLGLIDVVSDAGLAEVFVLPVGVGVGEVAAAWDDGRLKVSTVVEESPAAMAGSLIAQAPSPDPQWDVQPRHCYDRRANNTAYYDTCYQYATLAKDGDPNRVAWTHHQKGTGKSKGAWTLVKLTVQSDRTTNTPDQQWQDWSPEADIEHGNCYGTSVGVQVSGVGWSRNYNHCDLWDMQKDNPAVNWKVKWDGRAWRKDRNVAGMKAFSVPNGFRPTNTVKYDYEAW